MWSAIWLSLWIGVCAVTINLVPGLLLAWVLSRRRFPGKAVVEAVVLLPLVIPPVVTGYYLLLLTGSHSWLGRHILEPLGIRIAFTWTGMALAAAIMGFPLFVRTARLAFEGVDPELESAARLLGCSRVETFFAVTLPLAWRGIIAGAMLNFARSLGEFGATAVISAGTDGNRTIPLEIFRSYQTPGQEEILFRLSLVAIAISFAALGISEFLARRSVPGETREIRI